jgi:protein-tyrosine sulfotransferase
MGRWLYLSTQKIGGFDYTVDCNLVSQKALEVARCIRGDRKPAIIIHGVMPRSGTVYTGELLRLHPDIHAYPNDLWEIPFLELTGDNLKTQEHFFRAFKQNLGKIGRQDFLPLFGASLIAYLYSFVPQGKRMLIKIPDVQYLTYFFTVFPYETPLLLMRDGRDLVASTIQSWPGKKFSDVCKLWANSVEMVKQFRIRYPEEKYGYCAVKYEDVIAKPEEFIKTICNKYGLAGDSFPYGRIKDLPVRGSSTVKNTENPTWDPMEKPINFSSLGHWKDWDHRKRTIFKKIAGKALIDSGYSRDTNW